MVTQVNVFEDNKAREYAADGDEAVRKHPVVQARVQQNLVNSIERGNPPKVEIREQVEVRAEVETTREVGR
jgi:hypothetical protein